MWWEEASFYRGCKGGERILPFLNHLSALGPEWKFREASFSGQSEPSLQLPPRLLPPAPFTSNITPYYMLPAWKKTCPVHHPWA